VSLDPSTLQAAIYALLDANNIETDAHCVHVSMLPHDSAPIYIVLSNDTCARFLAVELTALTGRTGEPDELPPLSSLDLVLQKNIQNSGRIPPLAGPKFMVAWGARTTQDLMNRIKQAAGQDEPEATSVNLTAYILQMNGAKPGASPLKAQTAIEIEAVTSQSQR